jgi:hypothetical protein
MSTTSLKEKLDEKFDLISTNIPKNEWKYFHRGSLYNFIFYIELIKERSEREKTIEILFNCINDVELNFEPDSDYSIYLFNNYLNCIVPIYRDRLGFSGIPSKYALLVSCIVLITIFILLVSNFLWEVLFCSLVILIISKKVVNFKRHKAYGFCY